MFVVELPLDGLRGVPSVPAERDVSVEGSFLPAVHPLLHLGDGVLKYQLSLLLRQPDASVKGSVLRRHLALDLSERLCKITFRDLSHLATTTRNVLSSEMGSMVTNITVQT